MFSDRLRLLRAREHGGTAACRAAPGLSAGAKRMDAGAAGAAAPEVTPPLPPARTADHAVSVVSVAGANLAGAARRRRGRQDDVAVAGDERTAGGRSDQAGAGPVLERSLARGRRSCTKKDCEPRAGKREGGSGRCK